ncbi:hypothetical protein DTO195F2_6149 [Paecilomyces variotii]|nr:hypothetical protein DTO195F2_6149 [Paecilomyces variotii]
MWDTIDSQLGGITGPQTVEDEDHEQMPTAALIIIPETVSCATCGAGLKLKLVESTRGGGAALTKRRASDGQNNNNNNDDDDTCARSALEYAFLDLLDSVISKPRELTGHVRAQLETRTRRTGG